MRVAITSPTQASSSSGVPVLTYAKSARFAFSRSGRRRDSRSSVRPRRASRSFLGLLRTSPCAVVTYLDGWHLLLRDHQRRTVFEGVLAWTEGAPLPSRLDHPCRPEPAQS